MKTQRNSYPLRMPDDLRAYFEARAKKSMRSMNAEILMILEGERNKCVAASISKCPDCGEVFSSLDALTDHCHEKNHFPF